MIIAQALLTACAHPGMSKSDANIISSDEFVILISDDDDTLESLAEKWLGDKTSGWQIARLNRISQIKPDMQIAIPLKPVNPTGFYLNGHQRIPVLCYHRFDDRHEKLSVPEKKFRRQMQYLKDNNYNVIPLSWLIEFLEGKRALPEKSVVITIDDGYESTYDTALPVLQDFHFPATVFLYTDFLNASDALKWTQIKEMHRSGLVEFQPHSSSHPNLTKKQPRESEAEYSQRINEEIRRPAEKIQHNLNNVMHTYAYPFGDSNDLVIDKLQTQSYKLGMTVQPGSISAASYPYMLRRTMIFGDFSDQDFIRSLETFRNYTRG